MSETQTCNSCGVDKALTEFHRNKKSAGGRLPRCKECRKKADAAYVEANRDKIRDRARQWARANPQRAKERATAWAKAHPERRRMHMAKHRRSPQGRAATALYLEQRDPARRRAVASRYYERNRGRYASYRRTRRARLRGAEGSHTDEDVQAIGHAQRWRCAGCGCGIRLAFEVDHVIPLALGGSDDKGNLQLLCRPCNRRKGAKHPVDFARRLGRLL